MEGLRAQLESQFVALERLAKEQDLLSRLRAGLTWISEARMHISEAGGRRSTLDARYQGYQKKWYCLEKELRVSYTLNGCIFGQLDSCSEEAPVRCRGCG